MNEYIGIVCLIPAIILAIYAQRKVSTSFRRFSAVRVSSGLTGEQAARKLLDTNGLQNVHVELVDGNLSDHYDPRKQVVRLSNDVYHSSTIAAVSVACHECGHAIQHQTEYGPLKIRNMMAPVVSFASNLAMFFLVIGLSAQLLQLFDLGIVLFILAVLFQVITLPVEYDASNRAIMQMVRLNVIREDERSGAEKMLGAAALTYVAATLMAIAQLVRLIALRGRR